MAISDTGDSRAHRPLVPLADRAYPPAASHEDTEQQSIWRNPTERRAKLELFTQTPRPTPGRPPRSYDERHGTVTYFIEAGATKAIPSKFDRQIQHWQCFHTDCLQRPFDCRSFEPGHEKATVGGFGPQLEFLGTQRAPLRAGFIRLHEALDDVEARRRQAEADEFDNWRRQKMAEERSAAAAAERDRANREIAEREERIAWEQKKLRDTQQAQAAVEAEQLEAAKHRRQAEMVEHEAKLDLERKKDEAAREAAARVEAEQQLVAEEKRLAAERAAEERRELLQKKASAAQEAAARVEADAQKGRRDPSSSRLKMRGSKD